MRTVSPADLSNRPPSEGEAGVERLRKLLCALGRHRSLRDPIVLAMDRLRLTPAQVHTLIWLREDGPLTMGELSRRLGITEKTITGIVDRLVRLGHVARARPAEDRRVVRVRLTRAGAGVSRRLEGLLRGKLGAFLGWLTERDRRDLFRILEHLETRLASEFTLAPEGAHRKAKA